MLNSFFMVELMPHNEIAYEKLCKAMKENKQVIYTSGVGTGKSFVMLKYIDEHYHDKKCLYITPLEVINDNLTTYQGYDKVKDSIEHLNMQQFTTAEKAGVIFDQYDLIIVDEAHHLGSDIYGKIIQEAIRMTNIPCLGLTATPVRSDGTDIRNEFPAVVNGLSNFDAIRLGLMPQFIYHIGVLEDDLKEYWQRLNKEEKERKTTGIYIQDFWCCRDVIKDIAEKYPRGKYIVFSKNITCLRRDKKTIEYAFPNTPIREMHTDIVGGRDACQETLYWFNNTDRGILMTVDMALEGIHLKNVDGIILFRNVQSIPLFEQMLGRVCSIGKKISPVVIDCSARGAVLLQKLLKENEERWNNKEPEEKAELEKLYRQLNEVAEGEDPVPGEELKREGTLITESEKEFPLPDIDITEKNDSVSAKSEGDATEPREHENSADRESKNEKPIIPNDIIKTLGIGHKEWEDVETFEKAWAEAAAVFHHRVRKTRLDNALEIWNKQKNKYDHLPEGKLKKIRSVIAARCGVSISEFERGLEERRVSGLD